MDRVFIPQEEVNWRVCFEIIVEHLRNELTMGCLIALGLILCVIVWILQGIWTVIQAAFWVILALAGVAAVVGAVVLLYKALKVLAIGIRDLLIGFRDVLTGMPRRAWLVLIGCIILAGLMVAGWKWGPPVLQLAERYTGVGSWKSCIESARRAAREKRYWQARDLYMHAIAEAEHLGNQSKELRISVRELQALKKQQAKLMLGKQSDLSRRVVLYEE